MSPLRSLSFLSCAALLTLACGTPEEAESTGPTFAPAGERWEDQIIYQVITDRFANGDKQNDEVDGIGVDPSDLARFQGGDFQGLLDRLDYIENLGATTIWISPVVDNVDRIEDSDGYHGYWGSNFAAVNPHFGDLESLRAFVDGAHARGMRVIVDVVLNHSGRVFYYDLNENGQLDEGELEPDFSETPYSAPIVWLDERAALWSDGETTLLAEDHFRRQGGIDYSGGRSPPELEIETGDFPSGLRDIDETNPIVYDALVETYVEWVKQTNVDGYRLDVALHMNQGFWATFATDLRAQLASMGKENFLLVGEAFRSDPELLGSYTSEAALDTVFDFSLKFAFINEWLVRGRAPGEFSWALSEAKEHYRNTSLPGDSGSDPWRSRVTFIDNHDTGRLLSEVDDDRLVTVSLALIFTLDGIPAIYYGTEQGFSGQFGHESRERLWDSGYDETSPQYQLIQSLAGLRRSTPALVDGDLTVAYASDNDGFSSESDAGMLAIERAHESGSAILAINGHAVQTSTASFPVSAAPGASFREHLGSDEHYTVSATGELTVSLEPRTAVILLED